MISFKFYTESIGNSLIYLIPGEHFIGCNLECLSNGMSVAHQTGITHCKISIPGKSPET